MPFWRLYYHLVWATKYREELITQNFESQLYPYVINKARILGCHVYSMDGWADHVHLVLAIPPKLAVAEVVKRLKGSSSHEFEELWWQRGYGALSVGERQLSIAVAYVKNQKIHHTQKSTNNWLERYDDFDEGPQIVDVSSEQAIRENRVEYNIEDDTPF